jgi:TP901 family phage tail tape measure protein
MATTKAVIDIAINTSDAAAQLRNLQSQINAFNTALNKNNIVHAQAARSFSETLLAAANATGAFTAQQIKMETSAKRLDQTLTKGQATLSQYFNAKFRKNSAEAAAVLSLANSRVQSLQTQFVSATSAANGFRDAIAIRPLQAFNDSAMVSNERLAIHRAMLRQATTSMINFGKNTQWAGRQLMVGFTVPLTIFGAAAGKTFKEIEQAAVRFKKVYGDAFTTPEEIEQNMKAVEGLAVEFTKYGIAVKDTIGLAAEAAAAGAKNAELVAATTEATRLATLGQMEQGEALSATIALQNAFKLSTTDLTKEINFLNAVENQTVVTLQDLAGAIPRVAPVIVGLGGDVRDLAAMMAAMQEGGVSAAQGANALKSGLASLINPTNKATETLEKMGINITNIVQTNRGDLMGTVTAFAEEISKLDKFTRQQALEELFGKYQYARLGALFDNIIKDGTQASRVLQLAGLSAEQMATSAERELSVISEATSTKYMAAMERFKMSIAPLGEMFMKISTPIINFFSKLFEMFDKLPDGAKNFVALATIITGVVIPAGTMFLGLLMNLMGTLVKFGSVIGVAIKGLGKGGISGAVQAVSQSLRYMGLQEIEAAGAAQQLGIATDAANAALLEQVAAAGNARVAIQNLSEAYDILIAKQLQTAELSNVFFGPSAAAATGAGARPPRKQRRNRGGKINYMSTGATVPGVGNTDTVPAMLTPGEFVVNKDATQKNLPLLHAINNGNEVLKRNAGGPIPGVQYFGAPFNRPGGGQVAKNLQEQARVLAAMGFAGRPSQSERIGSNRTFKFLSEVSDPGVLQTLSRRMKSRAGVNVLSAMSANVGVGKGQFAADVNKDLRFGRASKEDVRALTSMVDFYQSTFDQVPSAKVVLAGLGITSSQAADRLASSVSSRIGRLSSKTISDPDLYSEVRQAYNDVGLETLFDTLMRERGALRYTLPTDTIKRLKSSMGLSASESVHGPLLRSEFGSDNISEVRDSRGRMIYVIKGSALGYGEDIGIRPGLTEDYSPLGFSYQKILKDVPGLTRVHLGEPQEFALGGLVNLFKRSTSLISGLRTAVRGHGPSSRAAFEPGSISYSSMERTSPASSKGRFWQIADPEKMHLPQATIDKGRSRGSKVIGHIYSRQFYSRHGNAPSGRSAPKRSFSQLAGLNLVGANRLNPGKEYDLLANQFVMIEGKWNTKIGAAGGGATRSDWVDLEASDMISLLHFLMSQGITEKDALSVARVAATKINARIRGTGGIIDEKRFGKIVTGSTIQALRSKTAESINVPGLNSGGMIGGQVNKSRSFYGRFNAKTVELFTNWISAQPSTTATMKQNPALFRGGFRKSKAAETLQRSTWLTQLPEVGSTMSLGSLASFSTTDTDVIRHLSNSKLRKDYEAAYTFLAMDQRNQQKDAKNLRRIKEMGIENVPSWAPERRHFGGIGRTGLEAYIEDTAAFIESRKRSIKKHKAAIREYESYIPTIIEVQTPRGTIRANLDDIVALENQQYMGRRTSEKERILHNAAIKILSIEDEDQGIKRIKAKLLSSEYPGFNTGGFLSPTISGQNIVPGTGNTDTVPAMLTPGEFVINKEATRDNLGLLHAINGGIIRGYQSGGDTANRPHPASPQVLYPGGQFSADQPIPVNIEEVSGTDAKRSPLGESMKSQRRMGLGMGMGAIGGAMTMAPMIPGVGQSPELSGLISGAGMGMSVLSMLPMIGAGGPVTIGLTALAAAAAAGGFALYKWRDMVDSASKAAADFGANVGGTANALNQAAEMFGTQTPAQRQAATSMGFTPEQQAQAGQEFGSYFGSEQGQKFIEDLKGATSEERFKKLSDYLKVAIASGMTDKSTAQNFAKTVGLLLNDTRLGAGVSTAIADQKTGSDELLKIAKNREEAVSNITTKAAETQAMNYRQSAKTIGGSIQVIQDFSNASALAKEEFANGKITFAEYQSIVQQSRDAQSKYTDAISDAMKKTSDFGATMQATKDQMVKSGLLSEEQFTTLEEATKVSIATKKELLSSPKGPVVGAGGRGGSYLGPGIARAGNVKVVDKDLLAAATSAISGGMDAAYATEIAKVIANKPKGKAAQTYRQLEAAGVGSQEAFAGAGLVRAINTGQVAGLERNRTNMEVVIDYIEKGGTAKDLTDFIFSLPEETRTTVMAVFDDMDQGRRERWMIDYNKIQGILGPDLASTITLSAEYKDANPKEKDSILSGINLFQKLPPSIDRSVAYDLAMTANNGKPLTLKDSEKFVKSINDNFAKLGSKNTAVTKKVSLDIMNTMGVSNENALKYMDEIQKKIKNFAKLPAEQQFSILTTFAVLGEAEQALANYLTATKDGGFSLPTYMTLKGNVDTARAAADEAISGARVTSTEDKKKTGGGGGGEKSLSEQLSEQLKEIRKLYAAMANAINPNTMKAIIAGPFAPEFIQYLAEQGEEGRKVLEKGRKAIQKEYDKFKEIKFTELAIQSRMAPGLRSEELRRQRGTQAFRSGLIGQGMSEEQVGYVMDSVGPDVLRARNALMAKRKKAGGPGLTDAEQRQLRDYNKNIKAAQEESKKFVEIDLDTKINDIRQSFIGTNKELATAGQLMAAGYTPEFAQEVMALGYTYDMGTAKLKEFTAELYKQKAALEVLKGPLTNATENLDIYGQTLGAQVEAINKLEIDPIQKDIDKLNKTITGLEKSKKPHQDAIDNLREEEEKLQEVYDERVKALDEVQRINQRIIDQQRGQMDVASALSRGDIAGAASAALELQRTMAQQRADDARNAVQQQFENERAVIAEKIKGYEEQIKAIDDQILAVQDAIAAKQDLIEQAKLRQLAIEEKLYKVQLLRDAIATKQAIQDAQARGAGDEATLLQGLLGIQMGTLSGLPGGVGGIPGAENIMSMLGQPGVPVTPGMPGVSASGSPITQFNENLKKELPKLDEAVKALTGENGLPSVMDQFVNGMVTSVNQFFAYVAGALNAAPIVIPPISIPWSATYNAGKGKTGTVSGVAVTKAVTTNVQKLASIVTEGQKKMYGGSIANVGSRERAPGFAFGSFVPGIGATDKVPAMLTPGEFVVRKPVAQAFGSQLEALNSQIYPSSANDEVYPGTPTRYRLNGIDALVSAGQINSISPISNYSDVVAPVIDTSSINMNTFPDLSTMDYASQTTVTNVTNVPTSVNNYTPMAYNYNINVSAKTNASADDIAKAIAFKMNQRQQRTIRGTKING